MSVPYIGITDFTAFWQVEAMKKIFDSHLAPGSQRRLHVGVMMSRKTLLGLPTKWSAAFPPKEKITEIFGASQVMNCLHYADYDFDPDLWINLSNAISSAAWG